MLLPALEAKLILDGCGQHWSGAMIAGITIPPMLLARADETIEERRQLLQCISPLALFGYAGTA